MNQPNRARQISILFAAALVGTGLLILLFAQTEKAVPLEPPQPFAGWQVSTSALPLGASTIPLAAEPYHHPSGAFSTLYPQGWQIDESEDSALFTAPDDSALFGVNFVAAGSAAGNSLSARAESDLRAAWGDLPGFVLQPASSSLADYWSAGFAYDQLPTPDQPALAMEGLAITQLREGVVFTQTYLARASLVNNVASGFQAIYESLVIDSHSAISDSE